MSQKWWRTRSRGTCKYSLHGWVADQAEIITKEELILCKTIIGLESYQIENVLQLYDFVHSMEIWWFVKSNLKIQKVQNVPFWDVLRLWILIFCIFCNFEAWNEPNWQNSESQKWQKLQFSTSNFSKIDFT